MTGQATLNARLVQVALQVADSEEAIRSLASLLLRGGYVKDSFTDAVLERERSFPTGLPTGNVPVAIPHADSVHVVRSAVAIGVLAKPVAFREMGEPDNVLNVQIVMMLAIHDPKAVVPFLQKTCGILQDGEFLSRLKAAKNAQEVVRLLRPRLNA